MTNPSNEQRDKWREEQRAKLRAAGYSEGAILQMEAVRGGSTEPHWLVKDFDVLYRAAEAAVAQAGMDGYRTAHIGDLALQLVRLAPAHAEIQVMKASLGPTVAADGLQWLRPVAGSAEDAEDRARGKGD